MRQTEQSPNNPADADRLKLITVGRITGLPHVVELRFVELDGSFYVLAGAAKSDWMLNSLNSNRVKLDIRELLYTATVDRGMDEERGRTLEAFRRKYGARIVKDWYPESSPFLKFTPQLPPTKRGLQAGEFEAKTDYETWKSQNHDYYRGVAEAFDSASEQYDFTIGHNFINTWIRKRSVDELLRVAKSDDLLIEIGCGTGAEAIWIAPFVTKIIATDISERMLEILRMKVAAKKLSSKIIPLRASASEIASIDHLIDGEKASLVYSFNGALNCEPHMERFARDLSRILKTGGHFICSIRNAFCLSESISHAVALQFRKMAPRKKQPTMISVGGMDIPSFYYSPSAFAGFFARYFRLKKQIALPGLLPPAYLNDYYLKIRRFVAPIERVEQLLSPRFPLREFGDQTLFIFQNL